MESENVVLTSTFVLFGSTVGGNLATGKGLPKSSVIIGGFFAMLSCAVLAEVDGELGGALSVAIAGTAFVLYGLPAVNSVLKNSSQGQYSSTVSKKKPATFVVP